MKKHGRDLKKMIAWEEQKTEISSVLRSLYHLQRDMVKEQRQTLRDQPQSTLDRWINH